MNNSSKINFKAILIGLSVDYSGTMLVLAFVMAFQRIPAADIVAAILARSTAVSVLLITSIIGLLFKFLGGFIGARIAKSDEIMHSSIIGAIEVVIRFLSLQSSTHLWLYIIGVILTLPVFMLGGYVAQGRNIKEQSLLSSNERSAKWPNMFKELTNFGYQRSAKEAFGFYIAYLSSIMFFCGILGTIVEITVKNSIAYLIGLKIGIIIAVIVSIGLSFFILKEKKLFGNFGFILLALLSGLLALKIGGMGGLIPVAYLTSKPVNARE
jgi:hypothetical protein